MFSSLILGMAIQSKSLYNNIGLRFTVTHTVCTKIPVVHLFYLKQYSLGDPSVYSLCYRFDSSRYVHMCPIFQENASN